MRVLSGSACVLVPAKGSARGARLVGDTYAVALKQEDWEDAVAALCE